MTEDTPTPTATISVDLIKKSSLSTDTTSPINWNDFNYPPYIRVIHFNPSELQAPHKRIAQLLWLSHIAIATISIVNLVNNIIQTIIDNDSRMRILFSFVFIILFNPLAGIAFYKGLHAFLERNDVVQYRFMSGFLCVAYLAFSIVSFWNLNGFTRIPSVKLLPTVLCVLESVAFLTNALLNGGLIYLEIKWTHGKARTINRSTSSTPTIALKPNEKKENDSTVSIHVE